MGSRFMCPSLPEAVVVVVRLEGHVAQVERRLDAEHVHARANELVHQGDPVEQVALHVRCIVG